jgi:putative hemolysin
MLTRLVVVVTAATMTAGLAACGGDGGSDSGDSAGSATTSPPASSSPSATSPVSSPTPAATDANGFPLPERPACAAESGGEFVRATTSEGNGVGILVLGDGPSGVVLGPQDGGDICMMLAYGEELAARYRVALYDWKEPRSEVPLLAVEALREAGADRVVLGGASYGGALAMSVAHRARPRVAGVLSFGGELRLPGEDFRPGIRKWRGPLLEISSKQDAYFDSADARRLRALHPGPETVLMLPGSLHGVDMLEGPQQEQVRATVDAYLARVLR